MESNLRNRHQNLEHKDALNDKTVKPKGAGQIFKHKHKKSKRLHVAPWNTPLTNRLETASVIWHSISIPAFIVFFFFTLSLGFIGWFIVVIPYFIWWYAFDLHTPSNGKVVYRVRPWLKNLIIWDWFVNYFPIRVHKMQELEPTFMDVKIPAEGLPDDEEDLISEYAITFVDKVFKSLGLSKRINNVDGPDGNSEDLDGKSAKYVVKREATGPRYIFGYHPHGVISMGIMGLFVTNALRNEPYRPILKLLKPFFHDSSKGERILPGIGNVFPLTLNTQFSIPFYRNYLLGLGLTSASAKNIKSLIMNGDNSVCLVVGGAQESLLNQMVAPRIRFGKDNDNKELKYEMGVENHMTSKDPQEHFDGNDSQSERQENSDDHHESDTDSSSGTSSSNGNYEKREIKLVLNKRKGFVKLAIELGNVSLVPMFGFGEADIYRLSTPKPGSLGNLFQRWLKSTFQFTLPFFRARGVFIYDFGFLPYRNPINIVIGRPIHVPEGILSEYKMQHPDFDRQDSPNPPRNPSTSTSFSSLFNLNNQKHKSSIKTKIPQELVDKYHKLYVEALKDLFEENKCKYGYDDVFLNILE